MKICKKCLEPFPFLVKIDGEKRNLCNRKLCLNCQPFGTRPICTMKECTTCRLQLPIISFYKRTDANKGLKARCKDCTISNTNEKGKDTKRRAIAYKGGACESCGYCSSLAALHFHHRDFAEKDFTISRGKTMKWEKLKVELDKCDLLCANCHSERHEQEGYKHLQRRAG